jgi:hypothetical protein
MDKRIEGYEIVERPPDPWRCGNCIYIEKDLCPSGNSGMSLCKRHDRTLISEWGVCPEHTADHQLRKIKDIQDEIREAKDMIKHFKGLGDEWEIKGWVPVLRKLENELEATRFYKKWGNLEFHK